MFILIKVIYLNSIFINLSGSIYFMFYFIKKLMKNKNNLTIVQKVLKSQLNGYYMDFRIR